MSMSLQRNGSQESRDENRDCSEVEPQDDVIHRFRRGAAHFQQNQETRSSQQELSERSEKPNVKDEQWNSQFPLLSRPTRELVHFVRPSNPIRCLKQRAQALS